jgi:sec-independent protein translocase protein TatC
MASDPSLRDDRPDLAAVPPPAPGEMTLLEHLRELRTRLIWSGATVFVMIVLSFLFRGMIFDFLLEPGRASISEGEEFRLVSFSPTDRIVVIFKLCLYTGLILSSPMLVYQTMAFVIPGLTPREKRLLLPSMAGVAVFLLGGMAFAYFIILPASLDFLLNFESDTFENKIGAANYIDFVSRIIFFVGLAFELPMVLALLARLGVVRARQLVRFWRYAIVLIAMIAAIVTPTPDALTMSLVIAPLLVLYLLGIGFAWALQPRRPPVSQA